MIVARMLGPMPVFEIEDGHGTGLGGIEIVMKWNVLEELKLLSSLIKMPIYGILLCFCTLVLKPQSLIGVLSVEVSMCGNRTS